MNVTVEWIYKNNITKIGIFRFGKNHFKYGDPYEFSCTIKIINNIAYFYGGVSNKEDLIDFLKYRNELKNILIKEGIKQVIWKRIKNNKIKLYKIKLLETKNSIELIRE